MKKYISIFIASVFLSAVSALSISSTTQGYVLLPQMSLCAADTFEFRFSESDFHIDPYIGLGYSTRYCNSGESRALIYGPALRFGLSANKEIDNVGYQLSFGAEGAYSNFPTVLFVGSEFAVNKIAGNGINYRASVGVMTWEDDLTVKIALGITRKVK